MRTSPSFCNRMLTFSHLRLTLIATSKLQMHFLYPHKKCLEDIYLPLLVHMSLSPNNETLFVLLSPPTILEVQLLYFLRFSYT